VYQEYACPRLEDHFIQHLIDIPFHHVFPLVPLFVHWTESAFGRKRIAGWKKLQEILVPKLREDVIYFTVSSAWVGQYTKIFQELNITVLFASSKGDPTAHIILPHIFSFNTPGYDSEGRPIWNLTKFSGLNDHEEAVVLGPRLFPTG
jgi:hypothetical protein